jgi:alkylation response protein AidB-like acyl-CoA dehydrogenase
MTELSTRIAFTDEQAMLLDTAGDFCREKSSTRAARAQLLTDDGFDRALWTEMVELGWSGITVPERLGGSGLSLAEAATITESMGRHLLATPFVGTQLVVQGLLAGGNAAQQASWLPRICEGAVGAIALFEEDGDWTFEHIEASAVVAGTKARLGGSKTFVLDAAVADVILASVALAGKPALAILVGADLPEERRRREVVIDETRRSFRLDLEGLEIPASSLIVGEAAQVALRSIRNAALLLTSAEAAGGIAGVLDVVLDYLRTRTAFGRKIGSFQALKHTCVDILVGLERTRSHVYHAATLLAGNEDAEVALRMAKAEAGDSFVFAGDRAVQFHGGFGFTWDCDAQLFLRRALWLQFAYGDAAHHRRHLADILLPVNTG